MNTRLKNEAANTLVDFIKYDNQGLLVGTGLLHPETPLDKTVVLIEPDVAKDNYDVHWDLENILVGETHTHITGSNKPLGAHIVITHANTTKSLVRSLNGGLSFIFEPWVSLDYNLINNFASGELRDSCNEVLDARLTYTLLSFKSPTTTVELLIQST